MYSMYCSQSQSALSQLRVRCMGMEEWSISADENSQAGLVNTSFKVKSHRLKGQQQISCGVIEKDALQQQDWNLGRLSLSAASANKFDPGQSVSLSFQNLSFSVKHGIRRATKQILQDLHGQFHAGELTAIMGPSGAGKSSLLNVLSGYTSSGVSGKVLVNGEERDMRTFCRKSCYIQQEDILPPMLTVHELMTVAAKLKLGFGTSALEDRVSTVMDSLGLHNCRKTFTSRLSGGQRKRLAIALELVNDPPLMFFDEPTSGLDSSTSKQCLDLLKGLAESGRTIVCTIHQPSATLFALFDHVYFVHNGRCLYAGNPGSLVGFLTQQKIPCPQYHNPADFMLEVTSIEEYANFIPSLSEAVQDGKSSQWRKARHSIDGNGRCHIFNELIKPELIAKEVSTCSFENECRWKKKQTYPASFWRQFSTIIVRNFRNISRNLFFTHLRLLIHISVGLAIGVLFYDTGNNAANIRNIFGLIFFSIMFVTFTSYSAASMYYPLELPVLKREHFNKWYSLKSYFLASNLSEAPIQILCTIVYSSIVYYLTSQPFELYRYLISTGTLVMVSLLGQSYGYLIGCSMSVTNASIFGPFGLAPFILFSGFFVIVKDVPFYLRWIFDASYFKYALHACMLAVFGFERSSMICEDDYCHYKKPAAFLKETGMDGGEYLWDWVFLMGECLLLRIFAYCSLFIQIRYLRK